MSVVKEFEKITLSTIADGAAEQLFQHQLQEVCKNIDDENTSYKTARTITLTLKLQPNADRDHANVELKCVAKLAPICEVETQVHITNHKGQYGAYQEKPIEYQDNTIPLNAEKAVD